MDDARCHIPSGPSNPTSVFPASLDSKWAPWQPGACDLSGEQGPFRERAPWSFQMLCGLWLFCKLIKMIQPIQCWSECMTPAASYRRGGCWRFTCCSIQLDCIFSAKAFPTWLPQAGLSNIILFLKHHRLYITMVPAEQCHWSRSLTNTPVVVNKWGKKSLMCPRPTNCTSEKMGRICN